MTDISSPTHILPVWLRASDLWKSTRTAENEASFQIPPELRGLPVCEIDCETPACLYLSAGAWCLPWSELPLDVFIPQWLRMGKKVRIAMVDRYRYFAEELGPVTLRDCVRYLRFDAKNFNLRLYDTSRTDEGLYAVYGRKQDKKRFCEYAHSVKFALQMVDIKKIRKISHYWRTVNWEYAYLYFLEHCAANNCTDYTPLINLFRYNYVLDARCGEWANGRYKELISSMDVPTKRENSVDEVDEADEDEFYIPAIWGNLW